MHLDRGRFSKLLRRDVLLTTSSHIKAVMFCNFNVDFPALLCGQSPRTPRYELPWHRGAVSRQLTALVHGGDQGWRSSFCDTEQAELQLEAQSMGPTAAWYVVKLQSCLLHTGDHAGQD